MDAKAESVDVSPNEETAVETSSQNVLDDISLETLLENENIRRQLEEATEKFTEGLRNEKRKLQDNYYSLQAEHTKLVEQDAVEYLILIMNPLCFDKKYITYI